MESDGDKDWARKYVLDPLTGPGPAEETGPGSSFRRSDADITNPPISMQASSPSTKSPTTRIEEQPTGGSTNPFRKASGSSKGGVITATWEVRASSSGSHKARSSGDLRKEAVHRRGQSSEQADVPMRSTSDATRGKAPIGRPRRSSSLSQRYPGDKTHQPLEILERENKLANRSPHLRKKHQPKADSIDALDASTSTYHHAGPYDAALLVRNTSIKDSPLAALHRSNNEALKATPADKIQDSLNDHYPLDGTAIVPPGVADRFGRVYNYEEGTDMQREAGGDYKRWPGVSYHPDDLKGKGEPSYSIEKALKEHEKDGRRINREGMSFELAERPKHSQARRSRGVSDPQDGISGNQSYAEWEQGRSGHGRNFSGDIRRRISKRQQA